jgi:MSHA biogenesis protein MshP
MRTRHAARRQRGFLIIAAVFLVVVLAGLVAYLTSVSTTSQASSAADFNSARAYQAARAGIEWGAYQILINPGAGTYKTACDAANDPLAPTKFDLTFGSTLTAFTATVRCSSSAVLTEGASTVKSYRIESNGCNEPTGGGPSCPNVATTSATYVERELRLTIAN